MQHVKIVGAPGFVNEFRATAVPGMESIRASDSTELVAIIVTEAGEYLAVPARCVRPAETPEAERYRREWSVKADRAPSDIYIPEALR